MKSINVLRKVKVEGVWKLLPVAKAGGRIDWQHLSYRGGLLVATEGTFYLEWRDGSGKKLRRAVGDHQRKAKSALAAQASVLNLRARGVELDDAPETASYRALSGPSIREVVAAFEKSPPINLRPRSRSKYSNALSDFRKWTPKTHLCELGREDILGFMSYLVVARSLDHSTAVDKGRIILCVMNDRGANITMKRGDWPKVTETERAIYEPDTLRALFAACDPREFVLFQTFLLTGFRDQEVGFLSWEDFNARKGTLSVTRKKELCFDPKNYQERTNPIPPMLVDMLVKHRKTQGDEYLVFPTSRHNVKKGCPGGQRDRHMLDLLKKVALRAGLNCGKCTATWRSKAARSCKDSPICKRFGLHMFRHTYATTLLQDGVDIRSLQVLLGHSDLESTHKYLRALVPDQMRSKINLTSLSTKFWR